MAWEERPWGRYYYRSERRGGRVVKRYFGRGEVARLAADLDSDARARRAAEAGRLLALREGLLPAERLSESLDRACSEMAEAVLTAAGFHRPNFAWRRRDGRPERPRDRGPARGGRGP
jgi:hypothetical protein